jgi:hypothetical protein
VRAAAMDRPAFAPPRNAPPSCRPSPRCHVRALGCGSAGSRRGTNYRGDGRRGPMLDRPTRNHTVATTKKIRI